VPVVQSEFLLVRNQNDVF